MNDAQLLALFPQIPNWAVAALVGAALILGLLSIYSQIERRIDAGYDALISEALTPTPEGDTHPHD